MPPADAAANAFGLGRSVIYDDRAVRGFRRRWPVGSTPDPEPGAAPDRGGR